MVVSEKIEKYINELHPKSDPLAEEMERLADQRGFPIVGPQVGRLLFILTRASGAARVLELGSGFGYSALWIARALPGHGRVELTELSKENLDLARGFLERAGLSGKARLRLGDALGLMDGLDGPFDMVFNDVDKEQYPAVVDRVLPLLRPGGLLVTDNALWFGKPADDEVDDPATAGVRAYNRRVMNHNELDTVILPLRDGVAISIKR